MGQDLSKYTDEELVKLVVDGASSHFGELYARYHDKVFAKCLTMTHDRDVAMDHAQDILMKAMQGLGNFKGKSRFSTWLYSITYNHCIEYLRKHKRIRFDQWEDGLDLPEEENENEVKEIMDLEEERLTLLLEVLKPDDKAILLLKYWEGMDLERIAKILGLDSVAAAKMRLMRARKRLRACFDKFQPIME